MHAGKLQSTDSGPVVAVVVAAGAGTRMGVQEKKPFISLGDKPLLIYSLATLGQHPEITHLLVVTSAENRDRVWMLVKEYGIEKVCDVIAGGEERQDSVRCGLQWICGRLQEPLVLIHDAARPFVGSQVIAQTVESAKRTGAATAAVPVKDTIKSVRTGFHHDETGGSSVLLVEKTLPRESLYQTQTPQVFRWLVLWEAHRLAKETGYRGTDDAGLVEWMGHPVEIVSGDYLNFKVTTPDDLWFAETVLNRKLTAGGTLDVSRRNGI